MNLKINKTNLSIYVVLSVLFVIFVGYFLRGVSRISRKIDKTSLYRTQLSEKLNQIFLRTGKYPEQSSDILNEIPHRRFTVKLQSYDCDSKSYKIVIILCFYQSEYMKIEEKAINGEIIYSKFDFLDSNAMPLK